MLILITHLAHFTIPKWVIFYLRLYLSSRKANIFNISEIVAITILTIASKTEIISKFAFDIINLEK
ncbi:MAG TPA: hypothetical protein DEO39_06865 [Clostridiales bacterium]|nr:hypothetical protein [Clostridiales bacterium]